jgi:asparagine synthetase B (glutamine-hydrolysing)
MLRQIQVRGTDATGAVWSENTEDGVELYFAKDAVDAETFIDLNIDLIPKYTRTALLHTRYATKGEPSNNNNNHPIMTNKVIGVHNGVITNDDDLFEELGVKRIAEVDSEAIFQLLSVSKDRLIDLKKLRGRAAIAWYDTLDPFTMHLARLEGSPLWVGHTEGGSTLFASTEPLLRKSAVDAGVTLQTVWEVPQYLYLRIVKGMIVERRALPIPNVVTARPSYYKQNKSFASLPAPYYPQPKRVDPFAFNESQRRAAMTLRDRMDFDYFNRR